MELTEKQLPGSAGRGFHTLRAAPALVRSTHSSGAALAPLSRLPQVRPDSRFWFAFSFSLYS